MKTGTPLLVPSGHAFAPSWRDLQAGLSAAIIVCGIGLAHLHLAARFAFRPES